MQVPPISKQETTSYVTSMKTNKAADIYGVTAEHLKNAATDIIDVLSATSNAIIAKGEIPESLKYGRVCPVPKKAKCARNPNNYRRITITSIIGKIVEKHVLKYTKSIMDPKQSRLQFGFTPHCSPVFAALALTEVLAEAEDNHSTIHIAFMDTSKAFDVVDHHSLLNALHEQGINGNLWNFYDSLYEGIKSVVHWKGNVSESFNEQQGIRQGGVTSADLYKSGKNNLLSILDSNPSNKIGHINTGALMVADDLAITADNNLDLQYGIAIAEHDSSRQRYSFNVDKTKSVTHNAPRPECMLNGKPIGVSYKDWTPWPKRSRP